MLELYHHGNSACAAKVRLALAEKGLDWEGHYIDIFKGEQFDPEYAKLNPKCVVPTLVHDGQVVRESSVICEYLDEMFPDPPLRPDSALERARMRIWTKEVDEIYHPATRVVTFAAAHRYTMLAKPEAEREQLLADIPNPKQREAKRQSIELGFDYPEAAAGLRTYRKMIGDMEQALSETTWLAGETYSLADTALTIYVNRLSVLSMAGLWEGRCPHVADWWDRVRARPSFKPAVVDWVPEDLARSLSENGKKSWPRVKEILEADASAGA